MLIKLKMSDTLNYNELVCYADAAAAAAAE